MNKCWFIWWNSRQEGPFSYEELKANRSITPDTLVWKEGMAGWTPIRNVRELDDLFDEDDNEPEEGEDLAPVLPQDEIALPLQNAEPPLMLWLLVVLILLSYLLLRLFQ